MTCDCHVLVPSDENTTVKVNFVYLRDRVDNLALTFIVEVTKIRSKLRAVPCLVLASVVLVTKDIELNIVRL